MTLRWQSDRSSVISGALSTKDGSNGCLDAGRAETPASPDLEDVISRSAHVHVLSPSTAKDPYDASRTALLQAVMNGHIPIVQLLISYGADVNDHDEQGFTPLHECANNGDPEMTQFLLDNGARLDVRDDRGMTPLQLAAANGNAKVVELLLERGADINARLSATV